MEICQKFRNKILENKRGIAVNQSCCVYFCTEVSDLCVTVTSQSSCSRESKQGFVRSKDETETETVTYSDSV